MNPAAPAGQHFNRGTVLFDAAVIPIWSVVSPFRKLVASLLESTCGDTDHISRVALTVHELLENAVKYGRGHVQVTVTLDQRGFASSIKVGNRTTPERCRETVARIADLKASKNREGHYRALLAAAGSGRTGGLGLARIAAEAEMDLSCHESPDAFVIVATPSENGAKP